MKKLILTALIGATSFGIVNAGGICWMGTATLNSLGGNRYSLSCPESNSTCYEAQAIVVLYSLRRPIQIHLADARIDAVVESAVVPEQTIPGNPPSYHTSQPIPVEVPNN